MIYRKINIDDFSIFACLSILININCLAKLDEFQTLKKHRKKKFSILTEHKLLKLFDYT